MKNAYLFVHFVGEKEDGEQIYFSVSKDGLHWTDLHSDKPVICSDLGEKGLRDPFIIKSVDSDKYFIIATDLRIASGKGWGVAQFEGSRNIVVYESTDLCNWSKGKLIEIGIPEAGCVWAPEAIYSQKEGAYLVFWASMVKESGEAEAKQRIYASLTKDFYDYSKPVKFIERDNHVIDTDIIFDNGFFYRFSKDETTKNIRLDRSKDLLKGPYEDIKSETLDNLFGVEGPQAYYLSELGKWCLIVDRFATGKGYLPIICDDLANGDLRILDDSEFDMGVNKKRHGSVISISNEEYERLTAFYGLS